MADQNRQLLQLKIRVPKKESSFTYFQLESNEGLAFYSTLPTEPHAPFCDLAITCDLSLSKETKHLLDKLSEKFPVEILSEEIINDGNLENA